MDSLVGEENISDPPVLPCLCASLLLSAPFDLFCRLIFVLLPFLLDPLFTSFVRLLYLIVTSCSYSSHFLSLFSAWLLRWESPLLYLASSFPFD